MKNLRLCATLLVLILFCAIMACAETREAFEPGETGAEAPDFALVTIDGKNLRLGNYRGRPIILYFWSDDLYLLCEQDMLLLQAVYDKWADQDLIVLAVDIAGYDIASVKTLATSEGLTFPILLDSNLEVYRGLYKIPSGVPISYFIDNKGVVKALKCGCFNNMDEIESKLSSILFKP